MKKTLVYTNDISDEEFKEMLRDYMTDEEVSSMSYNELYDRMSEYLDDEHRRVCADLNVQYNMPILVIADLGLWNGRHKGSGIATYRKGNFYDANNKLVSCRGTLDYIDFYTQNIMISTDTAWAPATKMWQLICDKYLPSDYEIFYDASEPGSGIFSTNRPDYLNHYILDASVFGNEGFSEEEYQKLYDAYTENADDNTIIQFLQDLLQTNETDLQKLFDLLHKSKFDDYVSIQPWAYTDISVWY